MTGNASLSSSHSKRTWCWGSVCKGSAEEAGEWIIASSCRPLDVTSRDSGFDRRDQFAVIEITRRRREKRSASERRRIGGRCRSAGSSNRQATGLPRSAAQARRHRSITQRWRRQQHRRIICGLWSACSCSTASSRRCDLDLAQSRPRRRTANLVLPPSKARQRDRGTRPRA